MVNFVPPVFDYVESQLPKDGFFFGDLGVADIAVATAIINTTYADFEVDEKPMLEALRNMRDQQVLIAHVAEISGGITATATLVYCFARVAHFFTLVFAIPVFKSLSFIGIP